MKLLHFLKLLIGRLRNCESLCEIRPDCHHHFDASGTSNSMFDELAERSLMSPLEGMKQTYIRFLNTFKISPQKGKYDKFLHISFLSWVTFGHFILVCRQIKEVKEEQLSKDEEVGITKALLQPQQQLFICTAQFTVTINIKQ